MNDDFMIDRQGGNQQWFQIYNGQIAKRVDSPGERVVEHTIQKGPKAGQKIYYRVYDGMSGHIVDMAVWRKEGDYGLMEKLNLYLKIKDKEGVIHEPVLSMNFKSRQAASFLKIAPNIDFSKRVEIRCWQSIKNDKKENALIVKQNGQNVKMFYTKANPGHLPQGKQIMFQGKPMWDFHEQNQFLENEIYNVHLPKIFAIFGPTPRYNKWLAQQQQMQSNNYQQVPQPAAQPQYVQPTYPQQQQQVVPPPNQQVDQIFQNGRVPVVPQQQQGYANVAGQQRPLANTPPQGQTNWNARPQIPQDNSQQKPLSTSEPTTKKPDDDDLPF